MNSDKGGTIKVFILLLSEVTVCNYLFKGGIKHVFQLSDLISVKKKFKIGCNWLILRKIKIFRTEEVNGSHTPSMSARQYKVLAFLEGKWNSNKANMVKWFLLLKLLDKVRQGSCLI